MIKVHLQSLCNVIVSGVAVFTTFYTIIDLMLFISDPNINLRAIQSTPKDNFWETASWSLFLNSGLISIFLISHSFLALPETKRIFSSLGLEVALRPIYVICTCLSLFCVVHYWQQIPGNVLWQFNTSTPLLWWLFFTIHVLAWAIIYVGTLCMDVNELLGIRQVYYSIRSLPNPNNFKSRQLLQLYDHIRHPSFISFTVLFWVIPIMSLDRLLLAAMMTVYMYVAWNPDDGDYTYQRSQYSKKFHELSYFAS